MKSRHSVFVVLFVAASVAACAVLPYSVVQYIDVCKTGFGAELNIESATVYTPESVDTLVITFRYASAERLSTTPRQFFINLSVNGWPFSISGTVGKVFDRGISDVVTVSAPLTPEQSAALANDPSVAVDYWIWVDVPDRGSGSALAGTQTVPLEVE